MGLAPGVAWDNAASLPLSGEFQKPDQVSRIDSRHIARRHQIPVAAADCQSREDSAQRTARLDQISHHREAEPEVPVRVADHGHFSRGAQNLPCNVAGQWRSIVREKSLIPAHSGAFAAGEHEARGSNSARNPSRFREIQADMPFQSICGLVLAGRPHERILVSHVPIDRNCKPGESGYNQVGMLKQKLRFCLCSSWLLMQTALFAAAAATPEPSPARITSVVRVDARTGRLVRVMDVSRAKGPGVPAVPDEAVSRVSGLVEETARNYGVDPLLVKSVIQTESAFRPTALSNKGAQGLMQLMPATARRFGVNDSFDPKENIEGGVKYLKYLQDLFQDDRLAIAAYNAGEGAVTKYNGVPPYKETTAYVEKVAKSYASSKDAAAKLSGVAPKAVPDSADSEQQEERHPSLKAYVDSQGHLHMTTE